MRKISVSFKSLLVAIAFGFCMQSVSLAADIPVVGVDWDNLVFGIGSAADIAEDCPLAAFDFGRTEQTVKQWLLSAQSRGALPFFVQEEPSRSGKASGGQSTITNEYRIIVLTAFDGVDKEVLRPLNVERSNIFCVYAFLFCKVDIKNGEMTVLYSIPINAAAEDALETPANLSNAESLYQTAAENYQKLLLKSLTEQLEPELRKLKSVGLDGLQLLPSYQVENVAISSGKVQALFGDWSGKIRNRAAWWYSGWLAADGVMVYPPLRTGEKSGTEPEMDISNPCGAESIHLNRAANVLSLDIAGLNCRSVKLSIAEQELTYKIWLDASLPGKYHREQEYSFNKSVIGGAQEYDERSQFSMALFSACRLSAADLVKYAAGK